MTTITRYEGPVKMMSSHTHGAPDNQAQNLDDILGRGKGDPDMPSGQRWVGVELPGVEHLEDPLADWVGHPSQQYELGDQMADHSDDQGYDKED